MDERVLTERLITYDTSTKRGLRAATGFLKGWLEARDVDVTEQVINDLPVIIAQVGPEDGKRVVFHGHIDVVPGREEQFEPRVEDDRLYGRGAYDMKGGLAGMMCALSDVAAQDDVHVTFVCVPDEEGVHGEKHCTEQLVSDGLKADFAITGEPTDLHIGVQAKGVLALDVTVGGTAAHGARPWLGDNAIVKAVNCFRQIEALPFSGASSELFSRPSINLSRIQGGDASNKVPDQCWMEVVIRYLPEQDTDEIVAEIAELNDIERVERKFTRVPAVVSPTNFFVNTLSTAVGQSVQGEVLSVGRDGASDAVAFLVAGIPAVEFGPIGSGHHGSQEWVSISSLRRYREALTNFILTLGQQSHAGQERFQVEPKRGSEAA